MRNVLIHYDDLVDKGLVTLSEREHIVDNTNRLIDEHGCLFGVCIEEYTDEDWERIQNASRTAREARTDVSRG